ncbi:MAG: hypothetical protein HDR26_09335 [Lachnospiraceae bacterium]|nr:hypothetical protein [Lachnospiraceae bacterium]
MKRISKVILVCVVLTALAACGQAGQNGDLAQEITAGADSGRGDSGKDAAGNAGEEKESGELDQGNRKEEEGAFSFLYEGVTLMPGRFLIHPLWRDMPGAQRFPVVLLTEVTGFTIMRSLN